VDPLSSDIGSVDLAEYLRRLRRRWWAVLPGIAVGIIGGLVLTNAQTDEYISEATVLVSPVDAGTSATITGGRTTGDINLDTEAQIVRSASLAESVSENLEGAIPADELMHGVDVTVPPNSQVMRISYTGGTPEWAQTGAAAYAEAYLDQRSEAVRQGINRASERLSDERDELREELDDVLADLAALPAESNDQLLLTGQRDLLIDQINSLNAELSSLRATTTQPGRIISEAALPTSRSAPNALLNVAAGVLLGLVLGIGLAVIVDHYDRRIRRAADIQRARFGVIGTISGRRRDVVSLDLGADDEVDRIRNRLVSYVGKARVIQVAPASPKHGCGLVGAALAASFAREYGRALYIVATDTGAVAGLLDQREPGLVEALEGPRSAADLAVWSQDLPRVSIVGPGRESNRLGQLLQPAATASVLDEVKSNYPAIVVETGSVSTTAGAQAVARSADAVVVVAERGLSDTRSLVVTGDNLSNLHARLAGVVLAPRTRIPVSDDSPESNGGKPEETPEPEASDAELTAEKA
jgi:capsular polysaccharide biosynthesis protein/Mrp family chromosome partitioning ATPase